VQTIERPASSVDRVADLKPEQSTIKGVPHSEADSILGAVVIPAIDSVSPWNYCLSDAEACLQLVPRVSSERGHFALDRLRQAFAQAESEIPGITSAFVLEIMQVVDLEEAM